MQLLSVLVTGSAGFIGFHLSRRLLAEGCRVVGLDNFCDYNDVTLKEQRNTLLTTHPEFTSVRGGVEEDGRMADLLTAHSPDVVIHLAAQAGVRYSIDNPRSYVDSNLIGTYEVLEACRHNMPKHLLIASTSSAYGANTVMPYAETMKADHQMSFYAATKKATESMAHSYAHLYDVPTTMFRFFTVYGPWGRPDMALFKFTKAILEGKPIDIYNHGDMFRDFTFIDDLVEGLVRLSDTPPVRPTSPALIAENDSLSPVAPFRVVNIGNGSPVKLLDFVDAIESAIGVEAKKNFMPMQPGDVPATWADAELITSLIGALPRTDIRTGVARFVEWYRDYYQV